MSRRAVRTAVVGAVCVAALAWWWMPREGAPQQTGEVPSAALFEDPVFVGYQQGEAQWRLAAERITEEADGYLFQHIWDGRLYQEGEAELTFTSQAAIWMPHTQVLTLEDSVEVARNGELMLRSDRLVWDGEEGVLRSPERVEVHLDGRLLVAGSLTYDPEGEHLVLSGGVDIETPGEGRMYLPGRAVYDIPTGRMTTFGAGELAVPLPGGG